jgi:hypothetical protein
VTSRLRAIHNRLMTFRSIVCHETAFNSKVKKVNVSVTVVTIKTCQTQQDVIVKKIVIKAYIFNYHMKHKILFLIQLFYFKINSDSSETNAGPYKH